MIAPKLRFKADDGKAFADWIRCKFSDFFKINSGYAFKYQDYCKSGVALINGQSIQHGVIDNKNLNFLPEDFLSKYKEFVLKENDIVIGLNRPITNGELKIAKVPKEYNNSLLYQRAGKIVHKKNMNNDFSFPLLSKEILKFTIKESVGSDQPFISTAKLDKWNMIIPCDTDEQQKIADFLSTIDTIIEKQRATVSAWEERKKGVMQKLFSQEVRFKADDGSDFPDWEEKKLQSIVGKISSGKDKNEEGSAILYGSTGPIGTCANSTYKGRKILIARVGANAGALQYVLEDCGVTDNTLIITDTNSCNFKWLYCNLEYKNIGKMRFGGGQPLVTGTMLHELRMNVPCADEQQKIADCLSALDTVIQKQKETLEKWRELKKGLLQQMFV